MGSSDTKHLFQVLFSCYIQSNLYAEVELPAQPLLPQYSWTLQNIPTHAAWEQEPPEGRLRATTLGCDVTVTADSPVRREMKHVTDGQACVYPSPAGPERDAWNNPESFNQYPSTPLPLSSHLFIYFSHVDIIFLSCEQ